MPVAPEFQDPAPVANQPPYFFNGDPPFETTFQPAATVTATIRDSNATDTLYVRWVSDYPPYTQANTRLLKQQTFPPRQGNQAQVSVDATLDIPLTCDGFSKTTAGMDHRLVIIVADRMFLPPDTNNLYYSYNFVDQSTGATVPIMAGWSVIGCQ